MAANCTGLQSFSSYALVFCLAIRAFRRLVRLVNAVPFFHDGLGASSDEYIQIMRPVSLSFSFWVLSGFFHIFSRSFKLLASYLSGLELPSEAFRCLAVWVVS